VATLASANEFVQAYTNEGKARTVVHVHNILDIKYDYKIDLGYKAYYKNRLEPVNDGLETDSIGFNIGSIVKAQFYFRLFDLIHYDIRFDVIPFDIVPLEMSLTYSRPAALLRGDPVALVFKALHKVTFLEILT